VLWEPTPPTHPPPTLGVLECSRAFSEVPWTFWEVLGRFGKIPGCIGKYLGHLGVLQISGRFGKFCFAKSEHFNSELMFHLEPVVIRSESSEPAVTRTRRLAAATAEKINLLLISIRYYYYVLSPRVKQEPLSNGKLMLYTVCRYSCGAGRTHECHTTSTCFGRPPTADRQNDHVADFFWGLKEQQQQQQQQHVAYK
jgi:hypothetical protein